MFRGTFNTAKFVVLVIHVIHHKEGWIVDDIFIKLRLAALYCYIYFAPRASRCKTPENANYVISEIVEFLPRKQRRLIVVCDRYRKKTANSNSCHWSIAA